MVDRRRSHSSEGWQDASTAPLGRNVEVRVADGNRSYTLKFPCRRTDQGWINVFKDLQLPIEPTHWREIVPAA